MNEKKPPSKIFWRESDTIIKRYGWTIDYYLSCNLGLFLKLQSAASDNIIKEGRDRLIPTAYDFYLNNIVGSSGKTSGWTFGKLLEELGLVEKQTESESEIKQKKTSALAKAQKIRELDRKHRGI